MSIEADAIVVMERAIQKIDQLRTELAEVTAENDRLKEALDEIEDQVSSSEYESERCSPTSAELPVPHWG